MRFQRETSVFKFLRQARRDFQLDSMLVVLWPKPYHSNPEVRISCMVLLKGASITETIT